MKNFNDAELLPIKNQPIKLVYGGDLQSLTETFEPFLSQNASAVPMNGDSSGA